MAKTHGPYPPEFRRRMIELVRAGRTPEDLEKHFEPTAQSIRNWVRQADLDEGRRTDGLTTEEREELVWLRRENRTLREGRAVSGRATSASLLRERIRSIHAKSRGTYGVPRVHAELAAEGEHVGRKRV